MANVRRLLLTGEAGVGKSHLLADVAEHHIQRGYPAVMVLGGAFSDADPWRQIADQLGLTTMSPDAILGALDAAGQALGTRALVIVDAINERSGVAVWSERLAAFLATADRFEHVGVLISCRTTFLPYIVGNLDEEMLPRLEHPGFAGHAAEAARRYLDQRGIVRMAVPNFSPEFENPLFLRTCCDMLERAGKHELPRGLAGVSSIFDFYFKAVVDTLNVRMGLVVRLKPVEKALAALTDAMVAAASNYLPVEEANAIFECIHPSGGRAEQSLFSQLESEGVLSVEPVHEGNALVDMVRLTFERLSDHLIAKELLNKHIESNDPAPAFATGGALAQYVSRDSAQFAGIAEAFAVQLPEGYAVELLDLVDDDSAQWNLVHAFQQSLLWRRQETFTERTLELLKQWEDVLGDGAVLETLLAIATEPENRFNADYLDRWLRPLSMPERDVEWSIRATQIAESGDSAIDTLIEWILANGLESIDVERARLAAMTLAWLTSLSHRWVRDMATKALATLLVDRRALAAELIVHFADVDDAYVVDRVLAAAYGAATRHSSDGGLAELALAAYRTVFVCKPLKPHALIRDHARGIIELAAARGVLPADVPIADARPPYPRGAALEVISKEMLAPFAQKYGESFFPDEICSSAVDDGDFARYEIDPMGSQFLQLPREELGRSMREIYEAWRATSIDPVPDRRRALDHVVSTAKEVHGTRSNLGRFLGGLVGAEEDSVSRRDLAEQEHLEAIENLERLLSDSEIQEFRMRAAGYVRGRMWRTDAPAWHPTYSGEATRRWVAWRAHQLGWTADRFEAFDRRRHGNGRMDHRIERIGKKYQWIAYHELAGRLSDIALVDPQYGSQPVLYEGPGQLNTREMDTTILVTKTTSTDRNEQGATWWSPHELRWRSDSPQERIAWGEDQKRDVPNPREQIDVNDADGRRWYVLHANVGRSQWVLVNGERMLHRETWHSIRAVLVACKDAERLVDLLSRSEHDRDRSAELDLSNYGYLGEYPWHPSFFSIDGCWTVGRGRKIPIYPTVSDWYVERSGHNYSVEDSFNLKVPAPVLTNGLRLRLADGRSLAYAAPDGTVLFKDPSAEEKGFSAAAVDCDAMRAMLKTQELEIVWIFRGGKSVMTHRNLHRLSR